MSSQVNRYFYSKGLDESHTALGDEKAPDAMSSDAMSSNAMSSNAMSSNAMSSNAMSSNALGDDANSAEVINFDTASIETAAIDTASIDAPDTAGTASTASTATAPVGSGLTAAATQSAQASLRYPNQLDSKIEGSGYASDDENAASVAYLFNALRVCGALFVVASMSLFLLQGWSEGNDVQRYLKLLSQTALLTTAGFGLAFIIKENRGARVFFGLSLLSIVSNFAVLGALLYSFYQLDGNLQQYPSFVTWQASDWGAFLMTALPAVVALTGLAYLIMLMFARQHAKPLTMTLIGLSLLLLLPIRSLWIMVPLAAVALVVAIRVYRRLQHYTFDTLEGKFAKAALFVPLVILLSRSLVLYAETEVMALIMALSVYAVIRQTADIERVGRWIYGALQSMGLLAAIVAVLALAVILDDIRGVSDDVLLLLTLLVLMGFCHDMLCRWTDEFAKNALLLAAYGSMMFIYGFVVSQSSHPFSLVAGFGLSILCLAQSYYHRTQLAFFVAVAFAGLMLYQLIINFYTLIEISNWVTVGLLGAMMIVAVSVLERYGARIKSAWRGRHL